MSPSRLIAPSGYRIKQHAVSRGIQRLADAGHQVNNVEVIAHRCGRSAGTEAEYLEDLSSLARLTTPNTIALFTRGDYGTSRLLVDIDWQALVARQQRDPLLICGHSDFATIQYDLLAQSNVITFSGPMLTTDFGADELGTLTEHHFWLVLHNKTFTIEWQGEGPTRQIGGMLWGGNLAMLVLLTDTPWAPKIEDGILVLEDINGHLFRVERMLLQFYHAGILPRQKAIILGSLSGSTPNDYDVGYNLELVYVFLRSRLSIPLITGLDFGHGQRAVTLPLGAHAILNNTQENTQLTVSGHPVLET